MGCDKKVPFCIDTVKKAATPKPRRELHNGTNNMQSISEEMAELPAKKKKIVAIAVS